MSKPIPRIVGACVAIVIGLGVAKVLLLADVHLAFVFLLMSVGHVAFGSFPVNFYVVYPEISYLWYALWIALAFVVLSGGDESDSSSPIRAYWRRCWTNSSLVTKGMVCVVLLLLCGCLAKAISTGFAVQPIVRLGGIASFRQVHPERPKETVLEISFRDVAISDQQLLSLREAITKNGPFTLDLSGTSLTNAGLEILTDQTTLLSLKLNDTEVSGDGVAMLLGCNGLRHLNLTGTAVGNDGIEYLSGLTSLEELFMAGTPVTDAGLEHLRSLHALKKLILWKWHVGEPAVETLKQALPTTDVVLAVMTPEESRSQKQPSPPERKPWLIVVAAFLIVVILAPFWLSTSA